MSTVPPVKSRALSVAWMLCVLTKLATSASPFPSAAPVLNVAEAGADPTGRRDSTASIQAAIRQVEEGHFRVRWIYLPAGTYRVSRPIVGGRFVTLIGDGAGRSVIQLVDGASAFADPKQPTPVLQLGRTANESFGVFVEGLTIDTGSHNPGAVGLDYQGHNVGAIRDLTIRSGDGSGVAGLKLKRSEGGTELTPGPHLVRGLTVEGFDRGVWLGENRSGICHVTFEHVVLRNQRLAGFHFDSRLHASIRRLVSDNTCPAILLERSWGAALLLSEAELSSKTAIGAAIINHSEHNRIHLHAVQRRGYAKLLQSPTGPGVVAAKVASWNSHPATIIGRADHEVLTTVLETPRPPAYPPEHWQAVSSGKLEVAFRSGKPVVYFPTLHADPKRLAIFQGITDTVTIPAHVQRLEFFGQAIGTRDWRGGTNPVFRIAGPASAPPLFISRNDYHDQHRFQGALFEHTGGRTVVFQSTKGSYQAQPGAGDVFFEDHVGGYFLYQPGQRVFARQLNPEDARHGGLPLIANRGAKLWVLGLKTEGAKTIVRQSGPGQTRILGGLFLPLTSGSTKSLPLFDIVNGRFDATAYTAWYTWPIHARVRGHTNVMAKGKHMQSRLVVLPE